MLGRPGYSKFTATMADTAEYRTLKKHIPRIIIAIQTDLTTLSVQLLAKNLISEENASRLRNERLNQNDRAADLVSFVLNRVKLNSENYKAFISILKESGRHFDEIIKLLELAYNQDQIPPASTNDKQLVQSQQDSNISAADLSVQSISSGTQTQSSRSLSSESDMIQHGAGLEVEPCTCSICTSPIGRPNHLPEKFKFPFLEQDIPQYDDHELGKQDLLIQLKLETQSLMLQFHEIVSKLYETVNGNYSIASFKFHLRAIKAFPTKKSSKESIFEEYKERIKAARDYDDIFGIIDDFISFIDYRLLEHLVSIIGSDRDKECMKQYCEKFTEYAKRRIIECPAIEEGDSTKWSPLYIKLDSTFKDENSVTIQQLQDLRFKVSKILHIPVCAIRYCCSQKGCITVNWQIPCFIEKAVLPLPSEQLRMLEELGVVHLSCGTYEYKMQIQEEHLQIVRNTLDSHFVQISNEFEVMVAHGIASLESKDKDVDPEGIFSIPWLSTKEQEEVLQECSVDIEGMLNLEQIFSHLYHHNLLSDSECEMLQASNVELSRKKKIARFITNLPRKGSNALDRFVQCLINSADGTGHSELAQIICNTVKERSPSSIEESEKSTSKLSHKVLVCYIVNSLILIVAAILLCSLVYINWSTITYHVNLIHSRSLPYLSENFVGREKDMEELSKLLDFGNKDVRTVNIYGSPGFGKSTLAIHFGHKMVKEGVIVHHVNMDDLPDKDIKTAVAEKILETSNIVSKNLAFEHLLRWARRCSLNTLVILDNCDHALHKQKEEFHQMVERVVEESLNIKILLTSREVAKCFRYFRHYKVEQLSTAASYNFLEHKAPSLTTEEKEQITNLTGNVPLALEIIGSLLSLFLPVPLSPTVLIGELKNELIETLSPKILVAHSQMFTTIDVSYKYLPEELQQIGRQLTIFPGSFGLPAAFAMHVRNTSIEPTKEFGYQLASLVRNSLLEYNQRTNRYQYHRLIKEYFLLIQRREWPNEAANLLPTFHIYYATELMSVSGSFKYHHKQSLAFLDFEQHNLEYTFENLKHMQSISSKKKDIEEFISVTMALSSAIDANFLQIRFSREKCCFLLISTLNKLDMMMPHLQHYLRDQSFEVETVLDLYVRTIEQVAVCKENHYGTWEAMLVFSVRKTLIESKSDIMVSSSYISFYDKLRNLYSKLDRRFEVDILECHRLIIKRINTHLATCQPKQCTYYDIGTMYHAMGLYQEASNLFEKEVKGSVDVMSQVRTLVKLVYIYSYMGEYERMITTTARLQNLYPAVTAISSDKLVEASDAILMFIQFYRAGELFDEARNLENLFLNSLISLKDKVRTAFHVKQSLMTEGLALLDTACSILNDLFEAGNFTTTIEICNYFIKLIETSDAFDSHKAKLHLLVGKAKFRIGQYSDGMDHIERALLMIPQNSNDYKKETMSACWYLIPRITYIDTCYQIKWNTLRAIVATVVAGTFLLVSPFPFPSFLVIYYDGIEGKEKPNLPLSQLYIMSENTTLATANRDFIISDKILFSVIQPQVQEILSQVNLALANIGRSFSFQTFAKVCIFLHSILWILIVWGKLIFVYKFIITIKRYPFMRKPRYLIKVADYCFLDYIFIIKIVLAFLSVLVKSKSFFMTEVCTRLRFVLDPRFKYGEDETPHSKFIDSLSTESDLFLMFSRMSI